MDRSGEETRGRRKECGAAADLPNLRSDGDAAAAALLLLIVFLPLPLPAVAVPALPLCDDGGR